MASKGLNFDKINAALARIPKEMQGLEVQVGYFTGNNYDDGTPVAYVATIHEFGAPSQSIPPRPTMGPTMKANRERYVSQLGNAVAAVQRGAVSGDDVLKAIGQNVAADIQTTMSILDAPALSPITLMLRKMRGKDADLKVSGKTVGAAAAKVAAGESYSGVSTKPLNDSGLMFASLQYVVVKK